MVVDDLVEAKKFFRLPQLPTPWAMAARFVKSRTIRSLGAVLSTSGSKWCTSTTDLLVSGFPLATRLLVGLVVVCSVMIANAFDFPPALTRPLADAFSCFCRRAASKSSTKRGSTRLTMLAGIHTRM
jgi:hypothetical protein